MDLFFKNKKREDGVIPEELYDSAKCIEGAKKIISINSYQRNSAAKHKCLKYYGATCMVCGFNFGRILGNEFKDFVHVHYKIMLLSLGQEYEIDPIKDLIPVCSNFHAILQRKEPPFSVYQVKKMIKRKNHNPRKV